jgi:hypothetical protein
MSNLNWRLAIGAARAAVATMAACLSRAARKWFTADGRTQTNDHRALARIRAFASMSPIGTFETADRR